MTHYLNALHLLSVYACLIEIEDFKHFQKSKPLKQVLIPVYEEIGLIVRPLSTSLCFSDAKILIFGQKSPRVKRGLKKNGWIIPGHEVLYEVIESIGAPSFSSGDIIHIQPSAIYHNKKYLLGFTEPGGLCTTNFIGEKFLYSDIGGNVLRLTDIEIDTTLSLIEPWSCIEADFLSGIKYNLKESRYEHRFNLESNTSKCIKAYQNGKYTIDLTSCFVSSDHYFNNIPVDIVLRLKSEINKLMITFTKPIPKGSSIIVETNCPNSLIDIDLHDIHYRRLILSSKKNYEIWRSSGEWNLSEHYKGHIILFGGAGPMGQMYLKRLLMENWIPEKITIVDRLQYRLDALQTLIERWISTKSVIVETIYVPNNVANEDAVFYVSNKLVVPANAIVVFCTDKKVIENCISLVEDYGVVNVFAGMPPGSTISISTRDLLRNVVLFGRSGSTIHDSKLTVEKIKKHVLSFKEFVAKVINLDDVWSALIEVKERKTIGKVLVLPNQN